MQLCFAGASLLWGSWFPTGTGLSTNCCCRDALLLLPRHLSALCISILLSPALSPQGSPSPAQPKLPWLRWQCPPSQQGHSPQELGLVTLQCTVFYSLGLAPDPLCTPAGRPGLAITSPPPLCLLHSLGLLRTSSLPSPRQGLCLVSCLCSIPSLTEAALSLLWCPHTTVSRTED